MNWTESSLNRYSRRKGWSKDQARQKENFAKARAHVNPSALAKSSNPRTVPFIPSYIPSNTPQPADERQQTDKVPTRTRLVGSTTSLRRDLAQISGEPAVTPSEQSLALSPPGKRKAGIALSNLNPRGQPGDLDSKRRKLLGQSDWTGIEFQKPLVIDYEQSNWEARQKHANSSRNYHGYEPDRYTVGGARSPGHRPHDTQRQAPAANLPMRLRVGSKSLQWSQDNNTVRTAVSKRGPLTADQSREAQDLYSSPRLPTLPPPSRPSSGRDWSGASDHHSSCARASPHQLDASELQHPKAPVEKPHYIVNSTPQLHHPRPARHEKPPVVDFSPEVAKSTVFDFSAVREPSPRTTPRPPVDPAAKSTAAEVGGLREPQHWRSREDRKWRSWLDVTCGRDMDGDTETKVGEEVRSVTPGVSKA